MLFAMPLNLLIIVSGHHEYAERALRSERDRREATWVEQQRRAYEMDDNMSAQFMYVPGSDRGAYSITFTKGSNGRLGISFAGDAVGQVAVRGFSRTESGDKELPAERCGYIFERDVCVEVNGEDITTEEFAECMETIQYASWPRTFKFLRLAATWDSDNDENADGGYGPGAQENDNEGENILGDPSLLRPSNTPFIPTAKHLLGEAGAISAKWRTGVGGSRAIPDELLHRDEQSLVGLLGGGMERSGGGKRGAKKKSRSEKRKEREARKRENAATAARRGSTSRSGRKVNRVSYAEFDEDDFSDFSNSSSSENEQRFRDPGENIERLVAKREALGGTSPRWEYLVKYKTRSYLHCEWQPELLLTTLGPRSRRVLQDYRRSDTKRASGTRLGKGPKRASWYRESKIEDRAPDIHGGRYFDPAYIDVQKHVIPLAPPTVASLGRGHMA